MLYHAYEFNYAMFRPMRHFATWGKQMLQSPYNPVAYTPLGRSMSAGFDVLESLTRRYHKPEWKLPKTRINGLDVAVNPRVIHRKPFCNLVHFERNPSALRSALGRDKVQPRLLLVAPMSGHYATLLRGTVEALLPDNEVFITDWVCAKQVPLSEGRFDLNDFIDYIIEMLEVIGAGANIIGVCQPGPAIVSAISVMSARNSNALPASMTLMGSPIDTRLSPTIPNKLAEERPLSWFKNGLIHRVPWTHPGFLRRVYPGFLQLGGFISMNQERHAKAMRRYFNHLVEGDEDGAEKHREFYNEYLAVLDLTEEFYLQTIEDVLQKHKLPKGEFEHRGQRVDPSAITSVALMTVEGELDDISGIGQTQAAHTLCSSIPENKRLDYVQPGVGHYGVFNGRRYREQIVPRMNAFYQKHFSLKKEKALRVLRPDLDLPHT